MKINVYNVEITQICKFFFISLYISYLFITAGIDVENNKIEKTVSIYGIAISILYIAYLCIVEKANIYRYAIYTILYIITLILDTVILKKHAKNSYIDGILIILITMGIFTGEYSLIYTCATTLVIIALYIIIYKIKRGLKKNIKTENKIYKNIHPGFLLCISNIITILSIMLQNFLQQV